MKLLLLIKVSLVLLPSISLGQVNPWKQFQYVLHKAKIGKEYAFDKSKGEDHDSLVLVYLGKIVTQNGRVLKILTSRWYWGLAPRATSRIIIFNGKNQYLGDYYAYDLPDKVETSSLVFIYEKESVCKPGLVNKINFKNGIPKKFFLKCKGDFGDFYTFSQNL